MVLLYCIQKCIGAMFEHSCDWIVEGTELFFAQIVSLGWSFW
jgi:hypothetical protein